MKLKSSDVKKILSALLLFILFIILFVGEIPYLMNTFNFYVTLATVLLCGIGVGVLFGFLLKKFAEELISKFQIFVSSIVLSMVIVPLLISWSNRLYTSPLEETLIFMESDEVYGMILKSEARKAEDGVPPPSGYLITVERETGKVEQIRVDTDIAENLAPGDPIDLKVRRGMYGIVYAPPQ